MQNIFERSAERIDLIERTGMRDELEARLDEQRSVEHRRLISERDHWRKVRDAVVPPAQKAAAEAIAKVKLLKEQLLAAKQDANDKRQRAYGLATEFEEELANCQIERHVPRFMHDAVDALQEPIDFLGGTVRFPHAMRGFCATPCWLRPKCSSSSAHRGGLADVYLVVAVEHDAAGPSATI
jgi:hypothetical protein